MARRHHLKSTNWVSGRWGGQGGVVSCFHAGDSFVEVRGGLIRVEPNCDACSPLEALGDVGQWQMTEVLGIIRHTTMGECQFPL